MKSLIVFSLMLSGSIVSMAKPVCQPTRGGFYVEDDASGYKFGAGSQTGLPSYYLTAEACQLAIRSSDPRMVCAPYNAFYSAIFNTVDGNIVTHFSGTSFTRVEYCSTAIANSHDSVVCLPSGNGRIIAVDFKYQPNGGSILGKLTYLTVDECKFVSASASSADDRVCTGILGSNFARLLDRQTGAVGNQIFSNLMDCSNSLYWDRIQNGPKF